jgi:hypothetical protein
LSTSKKALGNECDWKLSQKWILNAHAFNALIMREIFRQNRVCIAFYGSTDDEGVPKGTKDISGHKMFGSGLRIIGIDQDIGVQEEISALMQLLSGGRLSAHRKACLQVFKGDMLGPVKGVGFVNQPGQLMAEQPAYRNRPLGRQDLGLLDQVLFQA